MPASYFLGSRLLGTSQRAAMRKDDQHYDWNVALFCQTCGDIWGRIIVTGAKGWFSENRWCARHANDPACWSRDSAGSFIASWRRTFSELPPEVLEYEAKLRLERFEE